MLKQSSDPAELLLELQNNANPHQFWNSRETIVLLSAIVFVAAILFIWAAYIRKRRRKSSGPKLSRAAAKTSQVRRRKIRRRLKERTPRPRNPTLAETGGLPPSKDASSLSTLP